MDPLRRRAVEILIEWEKRGSKLDPLFFKETKGLGSRERRLLRELVYGVVRWLLRLDHVIAQHSKVKLQRMERVVLAALRVGAYQLLFLDSVPPWAAVSEMVEVVKGMGKEQAAGFVNAVLRAVAEGGEGEFPDREEDPRGYLSIAFSHPGWVVEDWLKRWGLQETERLCAANNLIPPLTIRVNTLRGEREELLGRLALEGRRAYPTPYSPWGLILEDEEGFTESELFKEGWFQVQDEGAQLVVMLLSPEPGERVLELCAAPGGKATHIAQMMRNKGEVVAVDISPQKLSLLRENCRRLGIINVKAERYDARGPLPFSPESFDRVLVDAPCTGLGVLRRNPDGKWRVKEEDAKRLSELQFEILQEGARVLKKGGTLLYSTCTLTREENEGVVERLLEKDNFQLLEPPPFLPPSFFTPKGYFLSLPHRHGTDGFFAAFLKKG